MRTLWVCLWWRQKRRRRVWLLIDELTCGLQMTGREAPSWGMPLLFSIQGGNEFLVIFQKGCPWAQASPLPGDRNRRESQLMWWWTLFFARFFDGRAHVEKVWTRIIPPVWTVFVKSKIVLCRHLKFLLERDEELPSARFECRVATFPRLDSIFDVYSQTLS